MARKARTDSAAEAVRIMAGSGREVMPPSHVPLDDMDWPYWHNVVSEFARADWTEHQLELAAMLARTMANLEQEQRTLRAEGFIAVRENGTSVENPRARAVKSLTGDILSLRRSLALHARARSGDNRDAARQRDMGRATQTEVEDDLLAAPE
ncbi:P27 family phage terminase small subunit [Novosphingobium sp. KN65.2]|uniref:P27 family phage terminase small subunit n=1 Tax=Novosphingobium sp. KN65.2 TaxID=1478134 RepID=UPI0005E3BD71|nr:P27 family phage terminase small subunit [Novosphingobium sp. KN65.2]CDO37134.1 Terminase small subunit [Novosphingobium sp. KN65.2]